MSDPIPPISTLNFERVRLRPMRAADADDLFVLHSDARVMRYWSHPAWTELDQAVQRLEKLERDRETSEFYQWAVTLDGYDALIGTVSLFSLNRGQRRAEVGYALASGFWGHGYATEMLRPALDFAFNTLELERLEADIDPRNEASCRLIERVGFVREGLLRERWRVADEVTDSAMYGLLRREYAAGKT
ncbi:MAG: GNAT family N-acetyltransferase [Rhodanobacteraceae bacterium]